MIRSKTLAAALVVLSAVALSACTQQTPSTPVTPPSSSAQVIAPVVLSAEELQGATIDLSVGQVIDITTGDLAVDSYSGEVADPAVAEFVQGRESGGATFNPGIQAIAPGQTQVTLTNAQGGIQPVVFTVSVTQPGSR